LFFLIANVAMQARQPARKSNYKIAIRHSELPVAPRLGKTHLVSGEQFHLGASGMAQKRIAGAPDRNDCDAGAGYGFSKHFLSSTALWWIGK
jgi:hypothetical protein